VLRGPQTVTQPLGALHRPASMLGVSAGTAAVLGLRRMLQAEAPTTAYMMVGGRCAMDCAFCTQAQHSTARSRFLSRVAWPAYSVADAVQAVDDAFQAGHVQRCCLQVTVHAGYYDETLKRVRQLHSLSDVPICVSIMLSHMDQVSALLDCGAQRVTVALDAPCERVYRAVKGCGWKERLDLLRSSADRYPDRIGTHLVVGLGESEEEMSTILQEMVDRRVTVGLFAFTPVQGTAWEDHSPPALLAYRRIQAGLHLLKVGACRVSGFRFSPSGRIVSYGLALPALRSLLADGSAFETAGCSGCNRPYYNERPGRTMYNYPRPLTGTEVEVAIAAAVAGLDLLQDPGRSVCFLQNGA
jgi:biotin synthase-related radical SAM superfamily protein